VVPVSATASRRTLPLHHRVCRSRM
jgi:hypothetical protein